MLIRRILLSLVLMAGGVTAHAATYLVPDDFPDIQAAIDFASSDDTIIVGPGVFRVNLLIEDKDIVLKSAFGRDLTNLRPVNFGLPILEYRGTTTAAGIVEGFTFSHTGARDGYPYVAAAIELEDAGATIRHNAFTNMQTWIGNGSAIYGRYTTNALIERNIFYATPGVYTVIWMSPGMTAINNSISTGRLGFNLDGLPFSVRNNTISDCDRTETSALPEYQFNNTWNIGTPPVPIDLSVDPEFIDATIGNMQLQPTSGLINQGDPASPLDPDGTRADIGAIPFDLRNASVYNLHVGDDAAHVTSTTPTFYWSFFDSAQSQTMFEIEMGTDDDWSAAELWQPGPTGSSDTSVVYGGTTLAFGQVVYWRLRAFNGTSWGAWKQHVIRINDPASPPVAITPVNQKSVSYVGVRLRVDTTSSPFGDDLTYDFELYADPALATLVDSASGVEAYLGQVSTDPITSLTIGSQYWWRARAHDGYQPGSWSTVATFEVREPTSIRVPSEYATIQAAIDAATEQDTVLVADGTYSGEGNRDLDFNGVNIALVSENGPESTTIDCGGQVTPHWFLRVAHYEDTTAVVDGFRVINGRGDSPEGVIGILFSGITVRNCLFEDNYTAAINAWAGNYDSIPVVNVSGCTFRQNQSNAFQLNSGVARIDSCHFDGNAGNGIEVWSWQSLSVRNSLFTGNGNKGLHMVTGAGGNMAIENNTFHGNGTGFHFYYEPPKSGGGTAAGTIAKNIFSGNSEYGFLADGLGVSGTVTCNDAYGNGTENWQTWGSYYAGDAFGNISEPPRYCDSTAGDFAIASSSACAPANNSCGVLIGAFAVDPECVSYCCAGLTGNVSMDIEDMVNLSDVTALVNHLFVTMQPLACPAEANVSGDDACQISLTDITILINYLFVTYAPPAPCNPACESESQTKQSK